MKYAHPRKSYGEMTALELSEAQRDAISRHLKGDKRAPDDLYYIVKAHTALIAKAGVALYQKRSQKFM